MSEPTKNGAPDDVPVGELSAENSVHTVWNDGDPTAAVEVWPNCGPSKSAWPPKRDELPDDAVEELRTLTDAMTAYKRRRGLEYLLWHDVLDVLHDMGYRKVAPPAEVPAPPRESTDP
jgi:hypothetical protein